MQNTGRDPVYANIGCRFYGIRNGFSDIYP